MDAMTRAINLQFNRKQKLVEELRLLAMRLEAEIASAEATEDGNLIYLNELSSEGAAQDPPDYLARVRSVKRARSLRVEMFGAVMCDGPPWSILIDLFEALLNQRVSCVKSASLASGVPMTTALRYLSALEVEGLVDRCPDIADRRRIIIRLSQMG